MDEDTGCTTKLVEYHSSFLFYDPGTISSPHSLDDDEYAWDTKSRAFPISSRNELIKALALSGNLVEVEVDNNNNNNDSDNILDCGEGNSDNESDKNTDDSNRTDGTSTSNGTVLRMGLRILRRVVRTVRTVLVLRMGPRVLQRVVRPKPVLVL